MTTLPVVIGGTSTRDLFMLALPARSSATLGHRVADDLPPGSGGPIPVMLRRRPPQARPQVFAVLFGNPESYRHAGTHDLGVVTDLVAQDVDRLADNVARYRAARAEAGLDPSAGSIVVLLHAHLAATERQAREDARDPLCALLRSSTELLGRMTHGFGMHIDLDATCEDDLEPLLERAFDRYCDTRALIGTVASAAAIAERVFDAGADELACFVDFGVTASQLRSSLPRLAELRDRLVRDRTSAAHEQRAPLSFAQERMWFTEWLHPDYLGYNEPQAIRLEGPLDVSALAGAFADLAGEQAMLRCRIVHEDGIPEQRIRPHADVAFPIVGVEGEAEEAVVEREIARESVRRFDLARGPLWLTRLLRLGPEHHVLILNVHHIVFDLVSTRSLTRGLSRFYAARLRGAPVPPRPHAPYGEYVVQQRAAQASATVAADLDHWERQLAPPLPLLALPADRPRPDAFASLGACQHHRLGPDLIALLDRLCKAARVTPFIVIATAYVAALRAASGQDELVVGTPIVDQPPAFTDTIGLFINTLALRVDLSGARTFADALACVRSVVVDAHDHRTAPFEAVVRRVKPHRDPSRNPVFQTSIEFAASASHTYELPGVAATVLAVSPRRAPFDLILRVAVQGDAIACQFEYATALFEPATIAGIVASFDRLLRAGLAHPEAPLEQHPAPARDAEAAS